MKEILDFRESIYILNKLPLFYKTVSSSFEDECLFSNSNDLHKLSNDFVIIKDIPRYFNIETNVLPKNIKKFTIEQYSGFSINFQDVKSTDDYLKSRFGNNSRYKLRRSIKKLENCFDISYKMYFGEIQKNVYDFIFNEFFKLLEIRSIEKKIIDNGNLKKRDYYYSIIYDLILQKKASFFVIYNGSKPIDICLNFHLKNIVYQLIRTYDINYSKFNTGYIDLIKQIDWCIANNISFINFSHGNYYWKRRWCNSIYKYDNQIFFNSNSIKSVIEAFVYSVKIRIKHILRERKIIDKYHNIKWKFKTILNPENDFESEVCIIDFNKNIYVDSLIDLYSKEYYFLLRPIYGFLFNFNEKEKDLKVYKLLRNTNKYLVVGNKNKIIISTKKK